MKPCPFCGGIADPAGWLDSEGRRGPECEECGATAVDLDAWDYRQSSTPESPKSLESLIATYVRRAAELPDRTSPPEYLDCMLVSHVEMTDLLRDFADELLD